MKAYSYKDSDIEALGEAPSHWKNKRLVNICDFIRGNSCFGKNDLLSEGKYVALQYGKTYKVESVNEQFNFYVNDEFYKSSQTVDYGDVIFVSTSETMEDLGHSVFYNREDIGLVGGEQILLKPNRNVLDGKYLFYASKVFGSKLNKFATGIKVFRFDIYDLKTIYINLPPLKEQKIIADFLDKAIARIDRIISIKEEQIDKLEDSVESKIKELVSLGLRGEKTKPTDIDWFSEIPESWRVIRLKAVLSKIGSGLTPKGGAASYVDEGVPIIRSQNVKKYGLDLTDVVFIKEETHEKMQNSKVSNNDVLLNITGASLGRVCLAEGIDEANVNQHVCIIRPFQFITPKFLYYLLYSEIGQAQVFSSFKGSGREGLNLEAIKSFRLPLPPSKSEQNEITDALDTLFTRATKLNQNINSQIKTLQNYRKSLIHECVTGKKQVADRAE